MAKRTPRSAAASQPSAEPPDPLAHIVENLRPLAVAIADLVPDPVNARRHAEKNLRAIASSLQTFGQRTPLVVNRKNSQVEKGNGTLEAARSLGWTHIAVVWVEDDPSAQRGYAIADNRSAELAEWDADLLAGICADLEQEDRGLFDALLLSELTGPKDDPKLKIPPLDRFQVLVDCRDARDQKQLDKQLRQKGYATRRVTSVAAGAPPPADISPEMS